MLKGFQHSRYVLELLLRLRQVGGQHVVAEVELALFAVVGFLPTHIVGHVHIHAVVVDGVVHEPVEGAGVVGVISDFAQPPVRDVHQRARDADADEHAVGFVVHVVFAGPPHAAAQALATRRYERLPLTVALPLHPAFPGRIGGDFGFSRVKNLYRFVLPRFLFFL